MLARVFSTPSSSLAVRNCRRLFSADVPDLSEHGKLRTVATTGYSFTDKQGVRRAKYGVFWGKQDPRNTLRTLPAGTSNVAAMLEALIDVANTAREEDVPPPLLVYTDLDFKGGDFMWTLSSWAQRDFCRQNGATKMANAELLADLHSAIQGLDMKIEHKKAAGTGSPNYVTQALFDGGRDKESTVADDVDGSSSNASGGVSIPMDLDVKDGDEVDSLAKTATSSSRRWPSVRVGAVCRTSKKGFASAGYCTRWDDTQDATAFRLIPYPITVFRAHLAGIEQALKEAYERDLTQVLIVTGSPHFLRVWKRKWRNSSDEPMANKEFYDRIGDLVAKFDKVHFRYETPKATAVDKAIEDKCTEGLHLPLVGKDRSEYELHVDDLTIDDGALVDKKLPVVHVFKAGDPKTPAGYVWGDENAAAIADPDRVVFESGFPQTIVRLLQQAKSANVQALVVRTNSPKLVTSSEARLAVWQRSGWRNSLHKRIARPELCEQLWQLKKQVKVHWQLIGESPTQEDVAAATRLVAAAPTTSQKKTTKSRPLDDRSPPNRTQ